MGLNDIILTPFLFMLLVSLAYYLRPKFTIPETRKYFLPALLAKFFGALFIGLLYQFYYGGGDTYYYFVHSGIIHEAFLHDFWSGWALLFRTDDVIINAFPFYTRMFWYHDPATYFVCQVAGFFDLITFHTYTSTALFFAVYSFAGSWSFFKRLNGLYPKNTKMFAMAILFFPTVVVWGSGLLKDSLTLGSTFWMVSLLLKWKHDKRFGINQVIGLFITFFIIYKVKIYILIVLMPSLFFWIVFSFSKRVKNISLKVLIVPFLVFVFALGSYFSATSLVNEDSKYSIDQVAKTAMITSNDIAFQTGAGSGSTYSLGELDGTFGSMMIKGPLAILTALFRPFIWEIRNPLMLLASFEGLFILFLTIRSFFKGYFFVNIKDPFLFSCLIFSLIFAFSVGFTYNFGTLMRYRIPMLAFYLIPFVINSKRA